MKQKKKHASIVCVLKMWEECFLRNPVERFDRQCQMENEQHVDEDEPASDRFIASCRCFLFVHVAVTTCTHVHAQVCLLFGCIFLRVINLFPLLIHLKGSFRNLKPCGTCVRWNVDLSKIYSQRRSVLSVTFSFLFS